MEMGINHFGEMHRLSEMVKPDICVMTNIGQCHLEFLGSRDGILKAKSEIFDFMNPEGTVCVNGDNDKLMTIGEVHGKRPVHFGLSPENDIYADTIVSRGLLGSTATIHTPDAAFDVQIPLIYMTGIFSVEYATGRFLDKKGQCPWSYQKSPWNISHVIRLDFAPAWFLIGLLFEKAVAADDSRT